jgi:FlaA1/EpsC-like NDP-sugar epimerase
MPKSNPGGHRSDTESIGRTSPPPVPRLRPALIVGAGVGGQLIAGELRQNHQWGLWPAGFVDDNSILHGTSVLGAPVLGDIATIPLVVEQEGIAVVVLAIPSAPAARLEEIAELASETGAEVMTMPPIGSILSGAQRAETLRRVRMKDVLGRPKVELDIHACEAYLRGKRVLVTGAAGSIGSELATQVAALGPAVLVLLDTNESGLFDLQLDLQVRHPLLTIEPVLVSIAERQLLGDVFDRQRPDVVFHAAAYKHVPLMEQYPGEAVRTNVVGTASVARAAARVGVERFVMVSTDKAVRPTSVMGASKRLAEVIVAEIAWETGLPACSVRFGNVLGTRGSVVPTFERQIRLGGPVTVTDRRMRRYFMTAEEAASLIIQSGAFGDPNAIYMLDMGEDVSILELAERVIELHGLKPYIDIPIEFTGIRAGEKLREDLSNDFERACPSTHPKVRHLARGTGLGVIDRLVERVTRLEDLSRVGSPGDIRTALLELVRMADTNEEANGRDGEPRARTPIAVGQSGGGR